MQKLFNYLMCLYLFVVIPSLLFGQTPLVSTTVNEALKRQLNSEGKFVTVEMADGTSFSTVPTTGIGDVVGPASSVANRVVFFDGLTGKLIKDSGILLSGSNTGDQTAIPNSDLATMVTKTYKGRTAGTTGTPEDVAVATLKTDLVLVKGDVGLGNVDNTSDANKPVSSATQTALDLKVTGNAGITGATNTKITYDAKGLVTYGTAATTADIAASTDKNYVTDAQAVVIGNTSGTNTGDNAANSSTTYIGTTAIALNRASASQALTGIASIDGNAATVTTNANLTGHVTSTGNAAVLGSFTSANLATAVTDETGSGGIVLRDSPYFITQISTPSIITASGALGITPASGSGVNVTLSTTGYFAVNTNQFYIDTSTGFAGIGTTVPRSLFDVTSGTANTAGIAAPNLAIFTGPKIVPTTDGSTPANLGIFSNTAQAANVGASLMLGGRYLDSQTVGTGFAAFYGAKSNSTSNELSGYLSIYTNNAATLTEQMRITSTGNVGIGTSTPNNILTLPIASATDPIADAWTVHCKGDYKDIDVVITDAEIQAIAVSKVKNSKVSKFTKRATVDRPIIEAELKNAFKIKVKESAKKDLEDYTLATGVKIESEDYINETLDGLWDTKEGKEILVDSKVLEEETGKKLLPKFQRANYGIIAEDAPPEAQVLDKDGNLQGVDPYALIGLLWAAMQEQERRINLLEVR